MKYTLFSRLFSVVMVFAMMASVLPASILAEAASEAASSVASSSAPAASEPSTEVESTAASSSVASAPAASSEAASSEAAGSSVASAPAASSEAASSSVASAPAASSEAASSSVASEPAASSEAAAPEMQTYTAEPVVDADGTTVTATATASADAFAVPVTLKASLLPTEAVATLAETEADEEQGAMALDIRFEDAEGNEVEPAEGAQVNVSFSVELPAEVAETIDPESLSVVHLPENADPEVVADAGEATTGTVALADTTLTAEFTVGSFSPFVVSWTTILGATTTVSVHFVDENGNDLPGVQTDEGHYTETEVKVADWVSDNETITGTDGAVYTYKGAHLDSITGTAVATIKASRAGPLGNRYWQYTYKETANGREKTWNGNTSSPVIYLVYEKTTSAPGGETTTDKTLTHEKTMTENADGTYDLNLTVSGASGTETNPAKVDVIYILDVSSSMDEKLPGTSYNRPERIEAAHDAIESMTQTLAAQANVDARFALVTFGASGSNVTGWVSSNDTNIKTKFYNKIPSRVDEGIGTNYEAGLKTANDSLLSSTRDDAQVVVIFVSDGVPTYYLDDNGKTQGSGGTVTEGGKENNNASRSMAEARAYLSTITNRINTFYTVGIGDADNFGMIDSLVVTRQNTTYYGKYSIGWNEYVVYRNTYNKTTGFAENPVTSSYLTGLTNNYSYNFFPGNTTDDLDNAFAEIAANVTKLLCTNVSMTDTLSTYVEASTTTEWTLIAKDADGKQVALPEELKDAKPTYNTETKTVSYAFPADYELPAELTFVIVGTNLQITDVAYTYLQSNNGQYPDTANPGTGTYAGQAGFYSNDNDKATVTYTYNGETHTENYPKPVVRPHTGSLTLTKTITGLDSLTTEQIAALESAMTFTVTGTNYSKTVTLTDMKTDDGYTIMLNNLKAGTYTVTEAGATVTNYTLTVTGSNSSALTANTDGNYEQSATVTAGQTATVAYTNAYTPSTAPLTITKTITGLTEAQINTLKNTLEFTVTGDKGTTKTFKLAAMELKDGVYTYTISDALIGETYTVTESGALVTNYNLMANGTENATGEASKTVTVEADETNKVDFTNTYTRQLADLTITKTLDKINSSMGSDAFFTFKIDVLDNGITTTYYRTLQFKTGEAIKQSVTITGLPVGATYTVTELSSLGYTEETEKTTGAVGTIATGATANFTNTSGGGNIPGDQDYKQNNFEYKNGQWVFTPSNSSN